MTNLVRALEENQAAIFLILALGGLFAFRWLWKSWREWRMSVFRLEREFAMRRLSRAVTLSALIAVLLCAEVVVIAFVIPGLPADFFLPTPTVDPLAQPIGTLSPDAMTQAAVAPQPGVSANMQGCVPDQIIITSPKPGAEVVQPLPATAKPEEDEGEEDEGEEAEEATTEKASGKVGKVGK